MSEVTGPIKQIACGRRKPNMTRKEYNDHHFQIHGAISDGCPPEARLQKYIQTPIFDYATGARPGGLNLNHSWVGRDDVTELYFRGMAHLKQVFASEHVRTKVGPDGPKFADFEATMVLLAKEYDVPIQTKVEPTAKDGYATVAMYFLSTETNERNGVKLRENVEKALVEALNQKAGDEVYKVECNVGFTSTEFDLNAYFGGSNNPQYALVYKIFLRSVQSVPHVRKAQKAFEDAVAEKVDFSESFIVFGKEALVLDNTGGYENGVRFDKSRQPVFDEGEYAQSKSHLDVW